MVLQEGRLYSLVMFASPVLAGFTPGPAVKSLSLMALRAAHLVGELALIRLLRLHRAFVTL